MPCPLIVGTFEIVIIIGKFLMPFLEIFLQYTNCILIRVKDLDVLLKQGINKNCYFIDPHLTVKDANERLEGTTGNPFAVCLLCTYGGGG